MIKQFLDLTPHFRDAMGKINKPVLWMLFKKNKPVLWMLFKKNKQMLWMLFKINKPVLWMLFKINKPVLWMLWMLCAGPQVRLERPWGGVGSLCLLMDLCSCSAWPKRTQDSTPARPPTLRGRLSSHPSWR